MRAFAIAAALLASACVGDAPIAQPPDVDRARFEAEVYPVLLRDCGFVACHGAEGRFFRVLGPGRTRMDGVGLYDPATTAEIDATFDRARSMLSGASDPASALLVRKPLAQEAGGAGHMGVDALGRNVYASREDPGWRAIAAWAGVDVEPIDAGTLPDAGADGAVIDAEVDAALDASSDAATEDAP